MAPQPPVIRRYTRRASPNGWLKVQLEPAGRGPAFLCEYTEVIILGEKNGRTVFKIMGGYVAVGAKASLTTANAKLYLNATPPGGEALLVVKYKGEPTVERSAIRNQDLIQQWADLSWAGKTARVTLNSDWNHAFTPIPLGQHAILAPDGAHDNRMTAPYANATPGMVGNDTWFPIGLNGSLINSTRYVHVGHLSHGCVTVYELAKWAALYTYLISHRVPGSSGKRVGQLVVKK